MSFQLLLAQTTLALSFLGIAVMVGRKIPALSRLPENSIRSGEGYFLKLKKKAQDANPLKGTKPEIFLQKILSKIRILSLKTDNKAMDWMQSLSKRIEKKNSSFFHQIFPEEKSPFARPENPARQSGEQDSYWKDIKQSVSQKKKSRPRKSKKS